MSSTTKNRGAFGDPAREPVPDPTRDPAFVRRASRPWPGPALDDLESDVTGPVHEPDGVDALVEIADLPVAALTGLVAVVGAVDGADVAGAVRWAVGHGVSVAVPGTGRVGASGRPTLVVTRRRIDRIVVDITLGTARVGVGAAWPAVRVALGSSGLPTSSGLVVDSCRRLPALARLRGATVVSDDGILWRVDDQEESDRWDRVRRGGAGIVTEIVLALA